MVAVLNSMNQARGWNLLCSDERFLDSYPRYTGAYLPDGWRVLIFLVRNKLSGTRPLVRPLWWWAQSSGAEQQRVAGRWAVSWGWWRSTVCSAEQESLRSLSSEKSGEQAILLEEAEKEWWAKKAKMGRTE
eukprot:6191619-Pleurochrysis_carterae.AAC.2